MEEALDPELAICDAHHHLWERQNARYFRDDFLRDTSTGHNIVSTIAVECRAMYRQTGPDSLKPVGETEFLESVATEDRANFPSATRVVAAIVGHADLTLGDNVAAVLDAHLAASPSRFRGIRHSATWDGSGMIRNDAAAGLFLDSGFRRGFAWLQRHGLSFDAWLYHPQLGELTNLARSFPSICIILDHIGGPLGTGPYIGKRDEVFQSWSKGIAELSCCPNVMVKLGGAGSTRSGHDWHQRPEQPASNEIAASIAPYFEFCIEKFGVNRCMFESNFPVDKASYSYVAIWNAFKRMTQKYSPSERQALFYDTATRVYRVR